MRLLWVDNDYVTLLNPLTQRLKAAGFTLERCATYEGAINLIEQKGKDLDIALLDVIVPANTKCLSYAGFEIAKALIENRTVQRIAFLSVVLKSQVKEYYTALEESFGSHQLKYVDKAMLLEPNEFSELTEFLKNGKEAKP